MVATNNAILNTVGASISGVTNTLTITNPSNTASSAARETITVGGGSAGDPTLNFNVSGATNWEMGIDNSVSDNLTIAQGTALGTNDVWRMTKSGQRTMPLQPAFLAMLQTSDNNVTGDATAYTLGSGNALTIKFDQGSNITTAGLFTAPVTGLYYFYAQVNWGNLTVAHTTGTLNIFTTARPYIIDSFNVGAVRTGAAASNFCIQQGSCLANMTAGDTAFVNGTVYGSTKTIQVQGSTNAVSYFCGYLVC